MKKTLILAAVGFALAVGPALAEKIEKAGGGSITAGGKDYKLSGSRTKVMVKGAAATRDDVKVGMDCAITGPAGGEASAVDCK